MSKCSTQQTLPPRSLARLPDTLSREGCHQVQQNGWPFFRAGIALVNYLGNIMLVKEAGTRSTLDGHEAGAPTAHGKWNLPCGPMRPWDNLCTAACYHGIDQTAHDFDLGDICHIGFRFDIDDPHMVVIYHADTPHLLDADQPNPDKVARIAWFNYEEIEQLAADGQLSDPELVLSAARAERDHISIPDEVITQYQSKYAHD